MEPTILILIMGCVMLAGAWTNSEIANYKQRRKIEINRRAWSIARPSYGRGNGSMNTTVNNNSNATRKEESSSGIWFVLLIFLACLFVMVVGTVSEGNIQQSAQQENTEHTVFNNTDFE